MFNGFHSRDVRTDFELNKIENQTHSLGLLKKINEEQFQYKKSEVLYVQDISFVLSRKQNGDSILRTQYNFSPTILSWIIGFCFFPLGFLIFIFAYNAKNEFELFLHNYILEL